MFRNNRSFGLIAVLAVLALVTLIFGTAVTTPPAVLSGNTVTTGDKAQFKGYAELKDAQLERRDAAQFGKASAAAAIGVDSFYTMQKEQREMQKEQRAASDSVLSNISAAAESVRSERYDALKDAQIERDDARRIGSATFSTQVPALDRCRPHRDEVDC